jgi:hypothetical protein
MLNPALRYALPGMKRQAFFPFLNSVIPWLDHGIHADTLQIGEVLRWTKVRG